MALMNNGLQQLFSGLGAIMRPGSTDTSSEPAPDAPTTPVDGVLGAEGTDIPANTPPAPSQAESAPPQPERRQLRPLSHPRAGRQRAQRQHSSQKRKSRTWNPLDINRNWSAVQGVHGQGSIEHHGHH